MNAKKMAFFVEGQTEQVFIEKLLLEMAGGRSISIRLAKLSGGGAKSGSPRIERHIPNSLSHETLPTHEALIYDCGTDNRVLSDILDSVEKLANTGYCCVIGLRDLYPKRESELSSLEKSIERGIQLKKNVITIPVSVIVAVHEVEAWFLSEITHFTHIDPALTKEKIIASFPTLGFNPYQDDMTKREHPANDLNELYKLAGKAYKKTKSHVERTVNHLSYTNIQTLREKIEKLNALLSAIDRFLDNSHQTNT